MASNLHVEAATEEDIPHIAGLMVHVFSVYPMERAMGNVDTPEGRAEAAERHLTAWREHRDETGRSSAVKCVHTDPETGKKTLAACGYWLMFDRPRLEDRWDYLARAEWMSDREQRAKVIESEQQMMDTRVKWGKGRGIAYFQYMATHPDWRRKGAATMCVQWGLDECAKLGIPAYLEASPTGALVYKKMGFEEVDQIDSEWEGESFPAPVLMWWPSGTKDGEKRPLDQ